MNPLDVQVDGNHYKSCAIQPVEYINANKLDYFQGNVVKYVTRWRDKNGIADLRKAIHYLELYINFEEKKENEPDTRRERKNYDLPHNAYGRIRHEDYRTSQDDNDKPRPDDIIYSSTPLGTTRCP